LTTPWNAQVTTTHSGVKQAAVDHTQKRGVGKRQAQEKKSQEKVLKPVQDEPSPTWYCIHKLSYSKLRKKRRRNKPNKKKDKYVV
jgi:hypothetical protein